MRTSTGESGGFGAAFAAGAGAPPGGVAAGGRQEASAAAHAVAVARATSARSGWRESRAGCMAGWGWGESWGNVVNWSNGVRPHFPMGSDPMNSISSLTRRVYALTFGPCTNP